MSFFDHKAFDLNSSEEAFLLKGGDFGYLVGRVNEKLRCDLRQSIFFAEFLFFVIQEELSWVGIGT